MSGMTFDTHMVNPNYSSPHASLEGGDERASSYGSQVFTSQNSFHIFVSCFNLSPEGCVRIQT